ncbi:hypothetical protein Plec18167_002201 [Paecilomyces lecythidis]|uniref:Uncharacterized protein n=1 Tax=Paecilomyces lecythidis TaxID=3004212 RepID=A0ABR3Y8I6_9EURO
MLESSRSFLFTEYATGQCGVFDGKGVNPEAWSVIPDKFSSYQNIRSILQKAKDERIASKARMDTYYDDDKLAELARS